jgi:hypothetical protein
VRFVEADFTRDPVAERLLAAGLDATSPSLFLLEGVAVYLEPAVTQTILEQFRQVGAPGSRLAISVSVSRDHDQGARARFQAAVAAMGEPARSTLDATEAGNLLANAGWHIVADRDELDDQQTTAKRDRLRSVGLLIASAGPKGPQKSRRTQKPRSNQEPQRPQRPQGPLALSALLSQALVAFTIEFDNEAEHRLPHRTTNHGASSHGDGPWLVSLAMWENCMRFVTAEPITVAELQRLARTETNLDGMRRWGYITIDGTAKKIHKGKAGPDAVLRATARGLKAREVWLPLTGLIEQRWLERFGATQVHRLRDCLLAVASHLDPGLPDCLPILGPDLLSRGPDPALSPRPRSVDIAGLPLPALLSRVLLSFAVDFERESGRSLAVGANVLRVLDAEGTRLRDLPLLAGISKEAVAWAMGILIRAHLAAEEPDPAASRGKIARLTPRGIDAKRVYQESLAAVEHRWQERFTDTTMSALCHALEALATRDEGEPPLYQALEPGAGNWRASVRRPGTLPYYPMVLHRGGYPDGS